MTLPVGVSPAGVGGGGRSNDDSGPDDNFTAALANAVRQRRSTGVVPAETAAMVARPQRDDPRDDADKDRSVPHHAAQSKPVKAILDGASEIVGAVDDMVNDAADRKTGDDLLQAELAVGLAALEFAAQALTAQLQAGAAGSAGTGSSDPASAGAGSAGAGSDGMTGTAGAGGVAGVGSVTGPGGVGGPGIAGPGAVGGPGIAGPGGVGGPGTAGPGGVGGPGTAGPGGIAGPGTAGPGGVGGPGGIGGPDGVAGPGGIAGLPGAAGAGGIVGMGAGSAGAGSATGAAGGVPATLAGQFAAQLAATTAPGSGPGGSPNGSTVIQPAPSAPPVHHGPSVILPNAATPVNPQGAGQPVTGPGDQVVGTTGPRTPVNPVIGSQTNPSGTAPDLLHGGTAPIGNPTTPTVPGTGTTGPNPAGTGPGLLNGGTAPTGNPTTPGSTTVPGTGAAGPNQPSDPSQPSTAPVSAVIPGTSPAGPNQPGTASDLLHGGSIQASMTPVSAVIPGLGAAGPDQASTTPVAGFGAIGSSQPGTTEGATAKRHGQGDASQVPDKTPEFVVGLPTPAQPASTVDPSVATAVSQPSLPTPAEQVAMRLVPLRRGPDGIHRMTIHLNPDDLGPISVVAEVRGGAIAVQLHSATEAGRAALQASLPDLRQNLIEGGFGSCALDLQQGNPNQSQPQPQPNWGQPERRPAAAPAPVSPTPVEETPVTTGQSALDLRV